MLIISALKVGDEVGFYRSSSFYGNMDLGTATVTKINGHGHITLSTGVVYDKRGNGRENSKMWLTDVETIVAERTAMNRERAIQLHAQDLQKALTDNSTRTGKFRPSIEVLDAMQAALNALREFV
jgi:hypothetical protein